MQYTTPFHDVRDHTLQTRIDIGFSEKESWRDAPAHFDAHTLTIQGHPVMEDWEDGYMRELARIATSSGGTVLEVGFGMGISARYIQEHAIDTHIIIEANKEVFQELLAFAEHARVRVIPLFGFWEDVVGSLTSGSVNGILFDTYPLTEADIHKNHFPFFTEAKRLLAPQGVLTYYSDEIDGYSPAHTAALQNAGFTNIDQTICTVNPPADCKYWKSTSILAPKITV